MYILHKTRERSGGYARTFLRQMEEVLPTCLERGITVVSNAGGLHPEALAAAVGELARRQGLEVRVASVSGDDITSRLDELRTRTARPSSTSTQASPCRRGRAGGDRQRLPPGPPDRRRARGRRAGGRDRSGHRRRPGRRSGAARLRVGRQRSRRHRRARSWRATSSSAAPSAAAATTPSSRRCRTGSASASRWPRCIADGSSVITKHPGTRRRGDGRDRDGAAPLRDRRPALPEPGRRGPLRHASRCLPDGPDRVRIAGVRGEPPPSTLKVTANLHGGWRNSMTLALTGAQVAEKARFAAEAVWAGIPGGRGALRRDRRGPLGRPDGRRHGLPAAGGAGRRRAGGRPRLLRGRRRDQPLELSRHLLHLGAVGRPGRRPLLADDGRRRGGRAAHRVRRPGGARPRRRMPGVARASTEPGVGGAGPEPAQTPCPPGADLVRVPLWVLVGARSGDKGGDANVGVWADEEAVAAWLGQHLSTEVFKALLPEVEPYAVSRYPLPNLWAVNFVVHGILGWGVASNLRLDTQAKGLGELLRSRLVDVPAALVASGGPAARLRLGLTPAPGRAPGHLAGWRGGDGRALGRTRRGHRHRGPRRCGASSPSLVLPRASSSRMMRGLARTLGGSARRLAPRLPDLRDAGPPPLLRRPGAVVVLFVIWLCLILLGFSLIVWWDSGLDFLDAVGMAGSSVTTLGIAPGHAGPVRRRSRSSAAGIGLRRRRPRDRLPPGALHRVRHPRDRGHAARAPRAGTPAWGPEILARHHWLDTMDELPPLYARLGALGLRGVGEPRELPRARSGSAHRSRPAAGWSGWSP